MAWRHEYQSESFVKVQQLWPVLANVARWAEIDRNIDYIDVDGEPDVGTHFVLKPKGGPKLRFRIGDFRPPDLYSDICLLPLAEMKTVHSLHAESPTRIVVNIEITGPLSWFWGLVVGRKHASGLPAQTKLFVEAAQSPKTEQQA